MQVALKSMPDFATASVDKLATETARLQIAGIKSFHLGESHECMSVNGLKIDEIASKIHEKLSFEKGSNNRGQLEPATANFVGPNPSGRLSSNRGGYPRQNNPYKENNFQRAASGLRFNRPERKYRPLHKRLPYPLLPSLRKKGHDSWDRTCPNYQ